MVWVAILVAPSVHGGLPGIVNGLADAFGHPFRIIWCEDSLKTVLILLFVYAMGIGIYLTSTRNYRPREEHGSAKWGNAGSINKKYRNQAEPEYSKILTQNTSINLNGRAHRHNLNVMVIGGSGAGKTRFYAKPNVMQANCSMVVLDPKL